MNTSIKVKLLDRLGRLFPRFFWQRYDRLARKQGFDELHLVLSFDCDTPQDAEAAAVLQKELTRLNIRATYAVPGAQLEENAKIYQSLAKQGAAFINHGARPHTVWQGDHYQSSAFYNLMTRDEIIEDIQTGHEIVTGVIGTPPCGFRGPHFGRFQRPQDLALIYQTIQPLGYTFATTTVPEFGFRYGPARESGGIYEFSLSGSTSAPISLLDSYTYINNPQDRAVSNVYANLLKSTAQKLKDWEIAGLLNIYVDPSHVVNNPGFIEVLALITNLGIPSKKFDEIVAMLKTKPNPKARAV